MAAFRPRSRVILRNSARSGSSAVSIRTSSSTFEAMASLNPATPHTRLIACFSMEIAKGSFLAISFARSSVAESSRSRSTTRFTSPMRSASSAEMRSSPVNSSSLDLRTPRIQGITMVTTPDPNLISGSPNRASSEHTQRSQIIIRSQPPARQ